MKKLQVPFNLDMDVLEIYEIWSDYIAEIYFPLHPSVFPSARQNDYPEVNQYNKWLDELIHRMKNVNINTMLLLNGTKVDYVNDLLTAVAAYLEVLSAWGLTGVVVADPILAEWVHNNFPNLKIRLSVLSNIFTIQKIKEIESLGYIKEICLPHEVNRDKEFLQRLHKESKLDFSVIVNSACRIHCGVFYWHQSAFNSNCGWTDNNSSELRYSLYSLTNRFSPNILKAPFILPEELMYYDEYFHQFKLEDRTIPTAHIKMILESYALRVNPENLISCLSGSCMKIQEYIKVRDLDIKWRNYIQTCKGECWNCNYCDRIMDKIKEAHQCSVETPHSE